MFKVTQRPAFELNTDSQLSQLTLPCPGAAACVETVFSEEVALSKGWLLSSWRVRKHTDRPQRAIAEGCAPPSDRCGRRSSVGLKVNGKSWMGFKKRSDRIRVLFRTVPLQPCGKWIPTVRLEAGRLRRRPGER